MKKTILFLIINCLCSVYVLAQQELKTIHMVHFNYDKYDLTDEAAHSIDTTIEGLSMELAAYEVHLIGHTDSDGSFSYNKELSLNRGRTVRTYLEEKGFPESQIMIDGRSYQDSLTTNVSEGGKAKNRRVEIRFIAKLSPLQIPVETWYFDADSGITFTYNRSGTIIHIPPHSLMDKEGELVDGEVRIDYREFRDAADFISFGVPMMYGDKPFNSGGMFEIRAFKNDEPLELSQYAPMEIEFMLTDTIPGLHFYEFDREQDGWGDLGELDRTIGTNEFSSVLTSNKKKKQRADCFVPFVTHHHTKKEGEGHTGELKDTLQEYFDGMHLGYLLAQSPGSLTELVNIGFIYSEERWKKGGSFKSHFYANTHYVGNGKHRKLQLNTDYYPIYVKSETKISSKTKEVTFTLQDKSGEHPVLKILGDRKWTTSAKYKGMRRTYMFNRPWSDIVLEHKGGPNFKMTLKGHGKFVEMDVTAEIEKKEKKNKTEVYQRIASGSKSALTLRDRQLDDSIAYAERYWEPFLMFSKAFMPEDEQCMTLTEWAKHFDNNTDEMLVRYDSLWNQPYNTTTHMKISHAIQTLPVPPVLRPMSSPEVPDMVQKLSLDGFGIFNCDKVEEMEGSRQLTASYIDQDGNDIEPEALSIIDYTINGAITYPPYQITINPSSQNALFLTAKDGRRYLLTAEDYANIGITNNTRSCTFEMKEVTGDIHTVQDLRDLLAL